MPAALAGTTWPGAVHRSVACSIAMLAALALSSHAAAAQAPDVNDAAALARPLKVLDPAYMDTTVKACTDFFGYANGRWLATDVIPAAYSSDGVGRDMTDRNELAVRSVLDDAMAQRHTAAAGSTVRKLGTYYATCMDSARAESDGMKPLDPMLDTIAAIRTRGALVQTIAALHERGVRVVFAYGATPDFHDTYHYIAEPAAEWPRHAGPRLLYGHRTRRRLAPRGVRAPRDTVARAERGGGGRGRSRRTARDDAGDGTRPGLD